MQRYILLRNCQKVFEFGHPFCFGKDFFYKSIAFPGNIPYHPKRAKLQFLRHLHIKQFRSFALLSFDIFIDESLLALHLSLHLRNRL